MQSLFYQKCYMPTPGMFATPYEMEGDGLAADQQLVLALVEWAHLTVNAVAKRAGVAASTINRHANGSADTRLGRNTINKLREAFPDFPGFHNLRPDLSPALNPADYLPIRIFPAYHGMGGGGVEEGEGETGMVPRQLIENELRGHPDNFQLINVRGDSMEPLFRHGDQLLIDLRDKNPIQPGAFAIFDGDAYLVKLVERVPGKRGFYRIFSANDRYSESEVEETETTIMGRPVWFARRL